MAGPALPFGMVGWSSRASMRTLATSTGISKNRQLRSMDYTTPNISTARTASIPNVVHMELGRQLDPVVALLNVKIDAVHNHLECAVTRYSTYWSSLIRS